MNAISIFMSVLVVTESIALNNSFGTNDLQTISTSSATKTTGSDANLICYVNTVICKQQEYQQCVFEVIGQLPRNFKFMSQKNFESLSPGEKVPQGLDGWCKDINSSFMCVYTKNNDDLDLKCVQPSVENKLPVSPPMQSASRPVLQEPQSSHRPSFLPLPIQSVPDQLSPSIQPATKPYFQPIQSVSDPNLPLTQPVLNRVPSPIQPVPDPANLNQITTFPALSESIPLNHFTTFPALPESIPAPLSGTPDPVGHPIKSEARPFSPQIQPGSLPLPDILANLNQITTFPALSESIPLNHFTTFPALPESIPAPLSGTPDTVGHPTQSEARPFSPKMQPDYLPLPDMLAILHQITNFPAPSRSIPFWYQNRISTLSHDPTIVITEPKYDKL